MFETASLYGPWFRARYDSECDGCCVALEDGDEIRADGQGGYLCEDCGME